MASLKGGLFDALKKEGYFVPVIDKYLISKASKDSDRAPNVNAPSQLGKCLRALYYSRTGAQRDGVPEPRSQRIFDNGDGVHDRLQGYLLEAGVLLLDEIPVHDDEHNIHGHTDGLGWLTKDVEAGVLEIKSINSRGFAELTKPKPEHVTQGLSYLSTLERHRAELHVVYPTLRAFNSMKSVLQRRVKYAKYYQHMKGGRKYTREEKIAFQVDRCMKSDEILYNLPGPLCTVVFLYENKDTQELKEYPIHLRDHLGEVAGLYSDLDLLERCVSEKEPPERGFSSKNDFACRYCDFRVECWG